MNITVKETITLCTEKTQLSLLILESGHVALGYFGKKLPNSKLDYLIEEIERASYLADTDGRKDFKLEQIPQIYPSFGNPDMRNPAHYEVYENGSNISDFRYESHEFSSQKEPLNGMPFTDANKNIMQLKLKLKDSVTTNRIILYITAFKEYNTFTQNVVYENHSNEVVILEQLMSLNLDFLTNKFEMITLNGAWGRENHISRRMLVQGFQGADSKRSATGHGQNPFIALVEPDTNETKGCVIAANLIYSGNFTIGAEVDMHQNTRLQLGINPFSFSWEVLPGESFSTPEVTFLYTDEGLNHMSQTFHRFYQECLIRSSYKNQERPVLINSWEAAYFDFDKDKLIALANEAKNLGVELFVLDDGWFGKRSDETSSLGDWYPNESKIGGSLHSLIEEIHKKGLQFGIWIEPEMISEDSELYRQHPDWIVATPHYKPQIVRYQYVLDLSKREVQDYVIEQLHHLFSTYSIDYVKWDMNRNITDAFSDGLHARNQKEFTHRYILGLYRILDEITTTYTNILFESCAGGGGRFDAGMLFYTPQIWTSDDSDAIARLNIQKGTSMVYPPVTMGCHVSAIPNHQVGRLTSLYTRGVVSQQGNMGYELDLLALSSKEKEEIKTQIKYYKQNRETLQFGKLYQLETYDSQNEEAWLKKNECTGEIIVSHINILVKPNTVPKRIRLLGLEENKLYQIDGNIIRSGMELMNIGLILPKPVHDFYATQWYLQELKV